VAPERQDRQFESGHPDIKASQFVRPFLFMSFTVYILFSQRSNKFYSGQTQDFDNRIMEHNSGETKSLKSGMPWSIVWRAELPTRAEAMALEKKIKSRGAYRFLSDLGIAVSRGA
jgi:putative endonuclease